jgi:hypothetical protein
MDVVAFAVGVVEPVGKETGAVVLEDAGVS